MLGGIGSLPGAMLGGLLIGLIGSSGPVILEQYKDVAVVAILVLVLIFRPTGLLGKPEIEGLNDGFASASHAERRGPDGAGGRRPRASSSSASTYDIGRA